jgi:hypothetical protein
MAEKLCHCGQPLHYSDPSKRELVEALVEELGEMVPITLAKSNRTFEVPRHYIALHGISYREVPRLGFKEITQR